MTKTNIRPIDRLWTDFAKSVLPTLAIDSPQYNDMRQAFFAGAVSMFSLINSLGQDGITDAMISAVSESIKKEIAAFAAAALQSHLKDISSRN